MNKTINISFSNLTDAINDTIINFNLTEIVDVTANCTVETNTTANATTVIPETSESSSTSLMAFYISIFVLVVPGTCAHVAAVYCLALDVKKKMSLVKQLLLALCVMDILGLCSLTLHHTVVSFVTYPSTTLCSFISFVSGFLTHISGALTTLMAVERCIMFRAPFWHSVNLKTWKLKVPIVMTTILLIAVALFPTFGLGYVMDPYGLPRCLVFPTTVPRMYDSPEGIYILTYAIVGLLTVAIDVTCNMATVIALVGIKNNRSRISDSGESKNPEIAMTKMLFWLSATFLVTLSPLYGSLVLIYSGIPISFSLKIMTHILAGLNFTIHPFIYIMMMKTYRKRARNLLCFCCTKDSFDSSGGSYRVDNPISMPTISA